MHILLVIMALLVINKPAASDLPSVEIKRLSGESVNINEYATNGKVTILSFWATWCAPCKRELDAIADRYEDWQADYNVELIAITIDNSRALAKVRPLVESKGWSYEVLADTRQELQQAMNFQTIPQTFVVNIEGKIVYDHNGYVPGDEWELEDVLKELAGN